MGTKSIFHKSWYSNNIYYWASHCLWKYGLWLGDKYHDIFSPYHIFIHGESIFLGK
jgi:hypothetical protein